ncbi:MAG: glycosyltransferase family 2 protein [Candidatus Bathyarchaeia archaeon]
MESIVSLIIPAYNEEKSIQEVITRCSQTMDKLSVPYEIIVINDGSTDSTAEVARQSSLHVTVISNKRNCGKGYSIRKGVDSSRGSIILMLDSDGEHNPREIPSLLSPVLKGVDIVAGSRFLQRKEPVTTKLNSIGNFFFNLSIMILTGRRVSDSQTGFRAMKRDVFERMNLQSDGYEIETEITVKSLLNGFSFLEVPVRITRRRHSVSKIKILPDSKRIMTTLIKASLTDVDR